MINLPKIKVIKNNLEEEIGVFRKFLFHNSAFSKRRDIFQAFPELEPKILNADKNDIENILRHFIINFYKKYEQEFNKIVSESEQIINERGGLALKELAKLMDYEWSKEITYNAIPTILPFSPFNGNDFNFSILSALRGKMNNKKSLFITMHEISHFVFFDILKNIKEENDLQLSKDLEHYFKEALTAVLLNQQPLCKILELSNYFGNIEIQDIKIKNKENIVLSFTDFIFEEYNKIKITEKKSFKMFLLETIKTLIPSSSEFSKKWAIWQKHGRQIYKDNDILSEYQSPIEIK